MMCERRPDLTQCVLVCLPAAELPSALLPEGPTPPQPPPCLGTQSSFESSGFQLRRAWPPLLRARTRPAH